MPFVPKKQAYNAKIHEVELGVGEKAVKLGGQNVLPFHTFDAEIANAPKIGVELTDLGMAEYTMPGEQAFFRRMRLFTSTTAKESPARRCRTIPPSRRRSPPSCGT